MHAYESIENHQLVLDTFGHWPSFHDGEVYRLILDRMRKNSSGSYYPSIELFIRGWAMTSEVTNQGHYKIENDSIVHFLFEYIEDLELQDLNNQNVLASLDFESILDEDSNIKLNIQLRHCWGLSGYFSAKKAKVISVTPVT